MFHECLCRYLSGGREEGKRRNRWVVSRELLSCSESGLGQVQLYGKPEPCNVGNQREGSPREVDLFMYINE